MALRDKDNFHYFASSIVGWNRGTDIFEVLETRRREDKGISMEFSVWKVPGKDWKENPYEINWYAPQVEGAIQIIFEEYDWPKKGGR